MQKEWLLLESFHIVTLKPQTSVYFSEMFGSGIILWNCFSSAVKESDQSWWAQR